MSKFRFLVTNLCLSAAVLICTSTAPAQQASMATNPSGKPFFQSVVLNTGQKQKMDFSVRAVARVKGRVFSDDDDNGTSAAAESPGIDGVKVSLRSRDTGYENFVIEQFTDASGTYRFEGLQPGRYSIEIDPAHLPAKFRMPEVTRSSVDVAPLQLSSMDIAVTPQRAIMGNVFIDNDNDGSFKPGKDTPVSGAVITVGGNMTVSDQHGAYMLRDLPSGRIGLVVRWPKISASTHVVLDLGTGPVTNRIVNVPMGR